MGECGWLREEETTHKPHPQGARLRGRHPSDNHSPGIEDCTAIGIPVGDLGEEGDLV